MRAVYVWYKCVWSLMLLLLFFCACVLNGEIDHGEIETGWWGDPLDSLRRSCHPMNSQRNPSELNESHRARAAEKERIGTKKRSLNNAIHYSSSYAIPDLLSSSSYQDFLCIFCSPFFSFPFLSLPWSCTAYSFQTLTNRFTHTRRQLLWNVLLEERDSLFPPYSTVDDTRERTWMSVHTRTATHPHEVRILIVSLKSYITAGSTRRRVNINNLAFKIRFLINTIYVDMKTIEKTKNLYIITLWKWDEILFSFFFLV